MDDILSQIIAYAPDRIDTETKARAMVPGPRNMYNQGQLVQPNADGSRPGYNGKKKINRDESYRTIVKDFTATSGPGTGKIFDDPAAIEIVKANLNKIKKQKNKINLFFNRFVL